MTRQETLTSIPRVAHVLGLAGLIPFGVTALSQWIEVPFISPDFGFRAGTIYGAVILSFLGGIRWGTAMKNVAPDRQAFELSGSVVASLVGWLSLLLSPVIGICLLIAGFLLQALWDLLSVEQSFLPQWFGKLRMLLTAGAVLALGAMLVRLTIS
jgi:Protein of unknown function (DUF3429)